MFLKSSICSVLLLFAAGTASFFIFIKPTPTETKRYYRLLKESAALKARSVLDISSASQLRDQVTKEFWSMHDGEECYTRIQSNFSEITLKKTQEKIEANEYLKDLLMVRKNHPEQPTLTAETGTFYFPSFRFTATQLNAWDSCRSLYAEQGDFDLQATTHHQTMPARMQATGDVHFSLNFEKSESMLNWFQQHFLQDTPWQPLK